MHEGIISTELLYEFSKNYNGKKQNIVITNAIAKNGINAAAFNNDVLAKMQHRFSIEIDTMKVTNQKSSGRCWLFAGLNLLREATAKKLNLEFFELSQNYLAFWDKFEKINYFLECILDTMNETVEGRLVTWLMQNPINDGGQWEMFVSLVDKYGVVPKDVMPETFNSSNTGVMNGLIAAKLREYASILRVDCEKGDNVESLRHKKEKMLAEMYTFLCIFFGEPPQSFNFEYKDKDKNFNRITALTPKSFYGKYVDVPLDDYVSIINAPTMDKPFNSIFIVKYLGNVYGGRKVIYLNTDIDTMKNLTLSQLKDKEPVWFGCDVGKMLERDLGILDKNTYRYDLILDMNFGLDKGDRLKYRHSCMTHAMVFTGVNIIEDDMPDRWRVENSWGEERGEKGYFVMSDAWFSEYMYQVVINKKYLNEELINVLKTEPIELAPWDPMGSLAL